MEDKDKRLLRFQNGSPIEIIETLLNSINNFLNNEIDTAAQNKSWVLVVIGIHAVALTIAEGLFGKKGLEGYELFLEKFVDIDEEGFDFSKIAYDIHNYRNVLAHRWLSEKGYEFGLDFSMPHGYEIRDGYVAFNPKLYYLSYQDAFQGKIWDYAKLMTAEEMEKAKTRLIQRYMHKK